MLTTITFLRIAGDNSVIVAIQVITFWNACMCDSTGIPISFAVEGV